MQRLRNYERSSCSTRDRPAAPAELRLDAENGVTDLLGCMPSLVLPTLPSLDGGRMTGIRLSGVAAEDLIEPEDGCFAFLAGNLIDAAAVA